MMLEESIGKWLVHFNIVTASVFVIETLNLKM
jgi:hypothetical protein